MKQERFAVLDGLRGMAALVVLVFHIAQQQSLTALPYAGLAVDFFYVLSGFVVAFAYENRLQNADLRLPAFLAVRVKRLYPLIFLGTAGGICFALVAAFSKKTISFSEVVEAGVLGLLVLPSFVIPRWPTAYPFNMASWSLTFEAFVNVIYGIIAKYLTTSRLLILTFISAVGLMWLVTVNKGITGGNNQQGWAFGFVRVMFPFFAGVLIYRFRPQSRSGSLAAIALLFVLSALLLANWPHYEWLSAVYVIAIFPLIVFAGSALKPDLALAAICSWIGALSYPVYILQGPVLRLGEELLKHHPLHGFGLGAFDIVQGAVVLGISWAGLKLFDEPLQRLMRGRFAPPSVLPLAQRP